MARGRGKRHHLSSRVLPVGALPGEGYWVLRPDPALVLRPGTVEFVPVKPAGGEPALQDRAEPEPVAPEADCPCLPRGFSLTELGDMSLLQQAFTHASYANEHPGRSPGDNERLEFLGDAVLSACISEHLVRSYPEWSEGRLTRVRAAVVCEASLARQAAALSLGNCLRLGKGEENGGGRSKPSILAGAFEALVGAVYLQAGMEGARRFVLDELQPVVTAAVRGDTSGDYKTRLQELVQRQGRLLEYRVVGEQGPEHQPVFVVRACLDGKELTEGQGGSKKEAEQAAARAALDQLSISSRI